MSSELKLTNLKHASSGSNNIVLASDGNVGITNTLNASGNIDLNGNELILDSDADSSITADTDDRIDFKVGGSDKFQIMSDGAIQYNGTDHGRMKVVTGTYTNTVGVNVDITLESDIRNIECMAYASVSSGGWMSGRYAIVSATTSNTATSVNTIWSIGDSNTTGVAPTFSKSATTTFRVAFAASDGVGGTATPDYYVRVIMS